MKPLFIIAPHFPPSALPPSQRVRLLVRHCVQFGFYPFAFTVLPKYREETIDKWMCDLLGNEYQGIIVGCFNQRITRKIGLGDLGLRMLPFLFFRLLKESRQIKPAFILYPVPPWYILMIAPIIKRFTGIKYGIDFIDPWVHEQGSEPKNFKYRASQWIARQLEGWVTRNADIIFSVSEGINDNLKSRHSFLANKPMYAVPYGAERNDFQMIETSATEKHDKIVIRYIGAIWNDCYPVLDGIMPAFAELSDRIPISLEFYGTSYAGEGLSHSQLDKWIFNSNMQSFTTEHPLRVSYKKAVELTMSADILFIIGGMQPYYAASKLMGLVVSGKPFLAFVHKDSFPAIFLKKLDYPYLVIYSSVKEELPKDQINKLTDMFYQLVTDRKKFHPISLEHPLVKENTAEGMSRFFLEKITNVL